MDTLTVFLVQLVMSITVFALMARWFLAPWLSQKTRNDALQMLLIPHTFRHLGLVFIVPGLVGSEMNNTFAAGAAYGDFAAAILAIFSIMLLRAKSSLALPLVWVFNTVGFLDLLNALRQAENVPHLGAAWFIPTFIVPVLLVTHVMIFIRLLSASDASRTRAQTA